MINIMVGFDNGDHLVTKMACSLEEAKEYYKIGKKFNIGTVTDLMAGVSYVKELDESSILLLSRTNKKDVEIVANELLHVKPKHITSVHNTIYATYRLKTFDEAISLMDSFETLDLCRITDSCTTFQPVENKKSGKIDLISDKFIYEFNHITQGIAFWIKFKELDGYFIKISVDIEHGIAESISETIITNQFTRATEKLYGIVTKGDYGFNSRTKWYSADKNTPNSFTLYNLE